MKNNRCIVRLEMLAAATLIGIFIGCSPEEPLQNSVRMAISPDYPPYSYLYRGKLTGIDVELGEMIAQEAGRELKIVNGEFYELVDMVGSGRADMAACALAVTAERRKSADFSDPYEFAGQTFLVRSGDNIQYLTDMREIPGFRIAAEKGSTGFMLIEKYLRERNSSIRLIGCTDNREAVEWLLNKECDAVILDPLVAHCLRMEQPEKLEILRDLLNHEEFAVAVSPHDPQLLAAANRVIHRLWQSGELYDLQQKHMKQSMTPDGNDVP